VNIPRRPPARLGRRGGIVSWVRILLILPLAGLTAASPTTSFFSPEAEIWLRETQVIPIRVSAAPGEKRVLHTAIHPAEAGEILQPATVLKGETTGFLRLRGHRAGRAQLEVDGQKLALHITPNPAAAGLSPKPQIISPSAGACLYGTITAGVEINLPSPDSPLSEPRLLLPDGRELAPRAQTLTTPGSARIYAFDLNADELPSGSLTLQASAKDAHSRLVLSEPVLVNVVRPDPSALIAGACSERINDPRPERFGEKTPAVATEASSGLPYVRSVSADPAWCFKETIDQPGFYQLTMRVRGDPAMGSFPSVGVILNEGDYALSGSRLVDTAWHRIPIGAPVRLEAGEQTITARFLNDVAPAKGSDRNLYLDRYELVRVSAGAPAAIEGGDTSMMMSGGDSMMMSSPMMSEGPALAATGIPPLRVSFNTRLHGHVVQGPLTLRGTCWRPENSAAPTVELVVNGEAVASQQGRDIHFRLAATALKKGPNTLQLRARSDTGFTASTPAETVIVPVTLPTAPAPRVFRYTVEDRAWDPGMAQRLDKERPVAAFYTNGDAVLTLPPALTGKFTLQMEARGEEFRGPPLIEAFLQEGGNPPEKIGEAGVKNDRIWTFGQTQLAEGPKKIILRFGNDAAEEKKGDRNWFLRAASLEESAPAAAEAPRLALLHPKKSPFVVGDANAVVVEVFSPDGIEWTDLLIDGQPQNLRLADDSGLGRVVLPFVTSALKAGEHTLQVRTRSRNGRETTSAAVILRVRSEGADQRYARAIHLLNRFGYGPEPAELADLLVMGEKPWLRDRLGRSWDDPGEQAAFQRALNEFPDPANKGQVVPRSIAHLLRSPNPVRTRFVLWTENHFSTWIAKADALNKWTEHQRFLELGPAPFGSLLKASATSPAMLVYLDQNRSFAKKLNENYAREIMELHTVGVRAGYSQEDVTALASILTGWTLTNDAPTRGEAREMARTFRFDPMLNAPAGRRVFGMEFAKTDDLPARQDRTLAAMEMLAAHPATAEFISRKLAAHYVSLPAPDSLVKKLTARFLRTGGDMTALLETIAESREFWASMNTPKVATPLDFSLRVSRLTGSGNANAVRDFLKKSGTGLFDRATPDGYPEADAAYADSNALLQRWRFTASLSGSLRRLLPQSLLPGEKDPWPEAAQDRALDFVSLRLTGRPLPSTSRAAGLAYLAKVNPPTPERAKTVAALVAQLPPTSLR
jgi:hypothetical protein